MHRLFFFVTICMMGHLEGAEPQPWDNRLLNSYCKQVCRNKGWKVLAEGRAKHKNQEMLRIFFTAQWHLSLPEARRLIVEETQKLISLYNAKYTARSCQCSVPFSIENLSYSLSFCDACYRHFDMPYIARVASVRGKIFYDQVNPITGREETILEESYEEAVRIVNEERYGSQF